ncbi:hypothetical protein JCM19239_981 [Vibrio variabilis]|uniref:Outer membrane protein OmpU n=1 Tax=Vibrio variabilis TaxID=990271 RepID=A0ABQ0JRU5_9VIBR|nr:hypothetical protein JCM19239_981 [Vibrio variabilis]
MTGIYYFNSAIRGYATYKFNNLKAGDSLTDGASISAVDADNSLRLGLRYDF